MFARREQFGRFDTEGFGQRGDRIDTDTLALAGLDVTYSRLADAGAIGELELRQPGGFTKFLQSFVDWKHEPNDTVHRILTPYGVPYSVAVASIWMMNR